MRVGVAQDLMADDDASRPVMQAGVRKSMNGIGRYFEHAKIALRGQMRHTTSSVPALLFAGSRSRFEAFARRFDNSRRGAKRGGLRRCLRASRRSAMRRQPSGTGGVQSCARIICSNWDSSRNRSSTSKNPGIHPALSALLFRDNGLNQLAADSAMVFGGVHWAIRRRRIKCGWRCGACTARRANGSANRSACALACATLSPRRREATCAASATARCLRSAMTRSADDRSS